MMRSWILGCAAVLLADAAAGEPLFKQRDIFPPQDKHVHSSSIVECPNGDFLASWFHGSGERTADDVQIQGARLTHGTSNWSEVFPMADTPGFPDCNPVLFVDRNQRLWMFWITVLAHRWECSQLKARVSGDFQNEGPPRWHWQEIIQLKPGSSFADILRVRFEELNVNENMWAEYAPPYRRMLERAAEDPYKRQTGWMCRIHPVTLASGRILLPLYSDGFNVSLMAISDDDGAHWRASGPIVGLGPIQPAVVARSDGALVAYMRDSGTLPGRVLVSTSADDGQTWSAAVDTDIPNPGSSLEVIALDSGDWVMICNDLESDRGRLTALLSDDEGRNWKWRRPIESAGRDGRSFAYPSVIQDSKGLVQLTYSVALPDGNKTIRHATMNAQWIKAKG